MSDYQEYKIPEWQIAQEDNVNCIILADLHWGAIDPNEFKKEIFEGLLMYLEALENQNERLDYVIIAGDLFDTKEMFSSTVVKEVLTFIYHLLLYTDSVWDTQIVILEGTRTHDNCQTDMISHIFNMCDIFVGNRVAVYNSVDILKKNNASILLIPEEYIVDQDDYYGRYFNDGCHYDLIIGHGMVDKIWYAKKDKDEMTELTKHMSAPVFKVDDLLNHCSKCYFGHVHMNKAYGNNNRFTYIGPYTNWEFGKTTKVGFYHVKINTKTHEVTDDFIENKNAKNYPTVSMKIRENMTLTELNDKVDTLIAGVYATTKNVGKIRLIVVLPQSIETWQTMKDFLIGKCGDMPNLKFILQIEENVSDTDDDSINVVDVSKNYLFDHSIDIYHRIQTFIKNKSGRDISVETIEKYLKA